MAMKWINFVTDTFLSMIPNDHVLYPDIPDDTKFTLICELFYAPSAVAITNFASD